MTKAAQNIEFVYSSKLGTVIHNVDAILHCRPLMGVQITPEGATRKVFSPEGAEVEAAVQTVVEKVDFEDARFLVCQCREDD